MLPQGVMQEIMKVLAKKKGQGADEYEPMELGGGDEYEPMELNREEPLGMELGQDGVDEEIELLGESEPKGEEFEALDISPEPLGMDLGKEEEYAPLDISVPRKQNLLQLIKQYLMKQRTQPAGLGGGQ